MALDLADPAIRQVFFGLYDELPRGGPGDDDCTARALRIAGPFGPRPKVLDVACGPGMQTLALAALLPDAMILAVDNHRPFLSRLGAKIASRGLASRVHVVAEDMCNLGLRPGAFDLVWCEGAVYMMGVERALAEWRPLLEAGGRIAFTEPTLSRTPLPDEVLACWAGEYDALTDVGGTLDRVRNAGYEVLGHFELPERAWLDTYYSPLEARMAAIAPRHAGIAAAERVFAAVREEIEVYHRFSDCYAYTFVVARPTPAQSSRRM